MEKYVPKFLIHLCKINIYGRRSNLHKNVMHNLAGMFWRHEGQILFSVYVLFSLWLESALTWVTWICHFPSTFTSHLWILTYHPLDHWTCTLRGTCNAKLDEAEQKMMKYEIWINLSFINLFPKYLLFFIKIDNWLLINTKFTPTF